MKTIDSEDDSIHCSAGFIHKWMAWLLLPKSSTANAADRSYFTHLIHSSRSITLMMV